ncbi:EAL domain-containing protein [Rhodoferax sp. OV413]|uniref:EAL domain-containing protein n=1 Tax=Rhodoferax sp. OV413 TaxID=1855285 RepID=UPI000B86186F|nr:EAL domain-containing protein [Rhodoferax sp. OV413]
MPSLTRDYLPTSVRQGRGPLAELMRKNALYSVFQPIVDLRNGSVYAHEALIRGVEGTPLFGADALFQAARAEGLLFEFELYCIGVALEGWGRLQEPGRLFVNISADALVDVVQRQGCTKLVHLVRSFRVLPRMLVLELTEHERVNNMDQLIDVVREVRAAGLSLALDDFGDGRSSLRLWSQVKPEIVKIDKYFTKDISQHADNLQTLQALKQIATIFGTQLVAEGIETKDDLRVLRDLDLAYGQGYLLGRPELLPRVKVKELALEVLNDTLVSIFPASGRVSRSGVLRGLSVQQAPCAGIHTTNDQLSVLFLQHPELHAIAIVDQGRPLALVNRHEFMTHYATQYYREVHGRKPCLANANHAPRLVERDHNVDELVGILTSQDQRYLTEGFIVTENGRYIGLGTGDQLVRSVTEVRLEAARHANPLTFLPGNIPISQHIERLMDAGADFVACYADLNHFKPFNDHYGYWRGDEMIRLVAKLALAHCDAKRDFVGHVGGDDFIFLFQSSDWAQRCEAIVQEFAERALTLFDDAARLAGGIQAEDRQGAQRFFPFTTLSIGAVRIQRGQYGHAEEVANAAALAKHDAKVHGAGLFVRGAADILPV